MAHPRWGWPLVVSLVIGAARAPIRTDTRVAVLCLAGLATPLAVPIPPIWPLVQLGFLLPFALGTLASEELRAGLRHLQRGRIDPWPVVILGVGSALALWAWRAGLHPDLTSARAFLPQVSTPLLVAGFGLFSVANAVLEEALFRGLLQGALESAWGARWPALVVPAVLFGTSHLHGVPSGLLGAAMAGTWGLLLGWARRRSGGLATPIAAHVAADATIFVLLVTSPA
jgi:hypothetical protein